VYTDNRLEDWATGSSHSAQQAQTAGRASSFTTAVVTPEASGKQHIRAYAQAMLVKNHVDTMREELECSLLHLDEAKKYLATIDIPSVR